MTKNFLLLNSDKTEMTVLGPKIVWDAMSSEVVPMDGDTLDPKTTVRNLDVIFNQDLSFNSHIKNISRTAFFYLRNIAKISHTLMQKDA